MHRIPLHIFNYLRNFPQTSGAELSRKMGIPDRTARRYVQHYNAGIVVEKPVKTTFYNEDDDSFDVNEFLEYAAKEVERSQKRDQILTFENFDFETSDPIAVIFVSCIHLGSRYTAYNEFRAILEKTLSMPKVYWASLGDDIDGYLASFTDKQAIYEQIIDPNRQIAVLKEILKIIKDANKLLFGVSGQHGAQWAARNNGSDPLKTVYNDLKVPYFDGQGYLKFKVGEQVYNVAVAHKFKGSSKDNPSHAQAVAFRYMYPNADVVVMGDKHFPACQQFAAYVSEWEVGNRVSPMVTLLQSGTAKTGPDPYTIRSWSKGYLGWPIVVFDPKEHKVTPFWYLSDVEKYLG